MKSFSVDLDDLHCVVHFIAISSKTHNLQVKRAITDLKKQRYPVDEHTVKMIDDVFKDCTNNPGFTFQLCDTDVVVALRDEFLHDSDEYLVGIAAHEISHAVNFIMLSLGINIDDDELRAIEVGNIMEQFLIKSRIMQK